MLMDIYELNKARQEYDSRLTKRQIKKNLKMARKLSKKSFKEKGDSLKR